LFLGSIWYVSFRLRVLFGLTRRWPLRIVIAVGFISSLLMMPSGHTHAGQMFPGTLLAPVFFPFTKGPYLEGSTKVFVS
jgi:hypothetical protein